MRPFVPIVLAALLAPAASALTAPFHADFPGNAEARGIATTATASISASVSFAGDTLTCYVTITETASVAAPAGYSGLDLPGDGYTWSFSNDGVGGASGEAPEGSTVSEYWSVERYDTVPFGSDRTFYVSASISESGVWSDSAYARARVWVMCPAGVLL